ncbi:hypothetical protein SAMN04487981_10197 [Streptomyces sp. cf386]|uniref:hypothetical protein n=1 Tax=Streptomyces sp. cf386 TaxID=1761904 RepID=UPI00087F8D2F|nr:hypothetical protein [Streptomyces sp. cf386]SDM31913.1 hypothetical protein SAMN04487981_10197 [Streptomyces sp. cf386]
MGGTQLRTGVGSAVLAAQPLAVEETGTGDILQREGFGYPYNRIAELLGLGVPNARQHVSRAQERLDANRHRQPVDSVAHRRLVQAFLAAAQSGDLGRLEAVPTADASE